MEATSLKGICVIVPFGPATPIRKFWIASALLRYSGARRTIIGKCRSLAGLVEIAGGVAADRHLDGGIDVSRGQPVTGGLGADRYRSGWWVGQAR